MAVGTLLSVAALVGLLAIGISSLRNYTAARSTTTIPPRPVLGLPVTKTALLGTVDDKGTLASLTVMVLRSNGPGGSIVSVPVNGSAGVEDPDVGPQSFQQVYAAEGDAAVVSAVQGTLAMTFDYWLVAPAARATALFLPIAPVPVTLPDAIMANPAGGTPQPVFKAGKHNFEAGEIVQALSSRVDNAPESLRRPTLEAIWTAIATKIGAGIGTAPATVDSIDSLLISLFAGPIGARGLHTSGLAKGATADVEDLDVAEATLVFATVAPSAMAAPRAGRTFRLLAPPGSEARLKDAIDVLLFAQGNVLSVSFSGPQQATTQIFSSSPKSHEIEDLAKIFAGAESLATDAPIEGIDITIIFGADYLAQSPATTTPGSTVGSGG